MARARKTARRTAGGNGSARTARRRGASGARRGGRPSAPRTAAARSAPATPRTDAAQVLRRQHDETRRLFQDLAEASGDARRPTFLRLADALAAHATVEERLLYPELARHEETGDLSRDAVEEHLVAKRLLADMLESRLSDESFDAKRRVLEDEVIRHVEEEEAILLPRALKLVGRERMAELGAEIERTFRELVQHEPRRNLPREAEGAPVLH
ncbi:MAG TPA: hemerythrin domain-containing protein [Anaeromyxobacter sp.]|nr:hemerythrin domain-containing protein [Anaeromyxobacter sp.]